MANINEKRGEELNQLSRLSFDLAANLWYFSVSLDACAALASLVLSFVPDTQTNIKVLGALAVLLVTLSSYLLRFSFINRYDNAETMRRQSVLTEGLGYPIKNWMFSRWRASIGKAVLNKFELAPRNEDYYRSRLAPSPRRLVEMTLESVFWTRQLYCALLTISKFVLGALVVVLAGVVIVLPKSASLTVIYGILVAVPLVISLNYLGWVFQLSKLSKSLAEIERDLDELNSSARVEESAALRLISEYNCQVVNGFPIPNWLFKKMYKKINDEWDATYGKKVN